MRETRKRQLRTFPNLVAKDFQHPHDVAATEALKAVPGLDKVIAKIMEYSLERVFYLENIASSIRVTPRMFGRLYRSLGWGCQILDLEEPELYVAHELGHVKAAHVLYTIMARNISTLMTIIGQATLGLRSLLEQGLVVALRDWYRKAELTSDRAGLLGVQELDPCMCAFMKMAGGASRLYT